MYVKLENISLSLTSQVLARINSKQTTILGKILNASSNRCWISSVTLERTINGTSCSPKTLARNYGIMTIVHPEPQCSPEWYNRVCGHDFRIVQAVEAYAVSCWTVVEVPWQLDWTATVVTPAWSTWKLRVFFVTIVLVRTAYLLYVAQTCIKYEWKLSIEEYCM